MFRAACTTRGKLQTIATTVGSDVALLPLLGILHQPVLCDHGSLGCGRNDGIETSMSSFSQIVPKSGDDSISAPRHDEFKVTVVTELQKCARGLKPFSTRPPEPSEPFSLAKIGVR